MFQQKFQFQADFPSHFTAFQHLSCLVHTMCFNSKRTSQAISPSKQMVTEASLSWFQFQADFPSHFTPSALMLSLGLVFVSIPSGLPKPFHLNFCVPLSGRLNGFNSKRTSQAISPWDRLQ